MTLLHKTIHDRLITACSDDLDYKAVTETDKAVVLLIDYNFVTTEVTIYSLALLFQLFIDIVLLYVNLCS